MSANTTNPCPHCDGWGFFTISKDPDREADCPECRGTGERTVSDPRLITHRHDPKTSSTAAIALDADGRQTLKEALITLLDEKPRTGDELIAAYFHQAETRRWPRFSDRHNVKRRLSDLHAIHHVVKESGQTRPSNLGKRATVWELAVPANEARLIVAMKGTA